MRSHQGTCHQSKWTRVSRILALQLLNKVYLNQVHEILTCVNSSLICAFYPCKTSFAITPNNIWNESSDPFFPFLNCILFSICINIWQLVHGYLLVSQLSGNMKGKYTKKVRTLDAVKTQRTLAVEVWSKLLPSSVLNSKPTFQTTKSSCEQCSLLKWSKKVYRTS